MVIVSVKNKYYLHVKEQENKIIATILTVLNVACLLFILLFKYLA